MEPSALDKVLCFGVIGGELPRGVLHLPVWRLDYWGLHGACLVAPNCSSEVRSKHSYSCHCCYHYYCCSLIGALGPDCHKRGVLQLTALGPRTLFRAEQGTDPNGRRAQGPQGRGLQAYATVLWPLILSHLRTLACSCLPHWGLGGPSRSRDPRGSAHSAPRAAGGVA